MGHTVWPKLFNKVLEHLSYTLRETSPAGRLKNNFRKRREADALLETETTNAEIEAPQRSNGNLNWLQTSKKEFKKEERTKARKLAKGKIQSGSHLDSQRLIGGQQAIPHSWPWQVFVKIEGKSGGYDCGGSIIGKWSKTHFVSANKTKT